MTLANAAITSVKYDLSTAFPVGSSDAGVTALARVGADGDTLEDLSDEIAAIAGDATSAKQDEILVDLVDIKGTAFSKDTHSLVDLALATSLATTDGKVDTISTAVVTTLDGIVDSILEDTGTTLPGLITTLDTVADLIMDILEGDQVVDDGETPFEFLIKRKGTEDVLVTKEMYELDDTDITAVNQVVSKLLEP
jgi:hypothetical protein